MTAMKRPPRFVINNTMKTIEEVPALSPSRDAREQRRPRARQPVFYVFATDVMKVCVNLSVRAPDGAFTAGLLWGLLVYDRIAQLWPTSREHSADLEADCVDLPGMMMRSSIDDLSGIRRVPLSGAGAILWGALANVTETHCLPCDAIPQFTPAVRREFIRGVAAAVNDLGGPGQVGHRQQN